MSQLQKRIQRVQRRDGPGIGFGRIMRDQPRAMALIATASSADAVKAALDAEADAVIVEAGSAAEAASTMDGVANDKVAVGALLPALSEADAEVLRKAGCDFVIAPLETTDSAAVDTEKCGHVVMAALDMEDNTLRALGPLGLDGLFVKRSGGAMTLAQQLGLVRLSTFSSTGLIVTVEANAGVGELRVLRDSGTGAVVAPAGTSADGLKALSDALRAVPAPKRGRREGSEIAIVPSSAAAGDDHEHDDEDDD